MRARDRFSCVALVALLGIGASPNGAAASGLPNCGVSVTTGAARAADVGALTASSDPASSYRLGLGFATGSAGNKDCSKAFAAMQKAASSAYAPAENALGELYETGTNGTPDYIHATQWYRSGAADGNARALYNLGRLIADQHAQVFAATLPPPSMQTIAHATAAPSKQVFQAAPRFEYRVMGSPAPDARYTAAAKLWQTSADAGDHLAQFKLGGLYASGLGVPKDPARAATLFRAAAPSIPEAQKALDALPR